MWKMSLWVVQCTELSGLKIFSIEISQDMMGNIIYLFSLSNDIVLNNVNFACHYLW